VQLPLHPLPESEEKEKKDLFRQERNPFFHPSRKKGKGLSGGKGEKKTFLCDYPSRQKGGKKKRERSVTTGRRPNEGKRNLLRRAREEKGVTSNKKERRGRKRADTL